MDELNKDTETEVQDRVSAVGMSKSSRNIMILGIILLTIFALFYILSSSSDSENVKPEKAQHDIQKSLDASRPVAVEKDPILKLPVQLPKLPDLVAPPEPPPSFVEQLKPHLPNVVLPTYSQERSKKEDRVDVPSIVYNTPLERKRPSIIQDRNTPMLVISGSGGDTSSAGSKGIDISDPSSLVSSGALGKIRDSFKQKDTVIDENAPIKRTSSEQVKITYIGNKKVIIAQGKIIDAVLETAINTDLKGMLRAIVSRDVYSEEGHMVLLPKGSRLIGSYNSSIGPSQVRIDVIWNRVIRPDGIDLQLDSPATDQLGRAGVGGIVNTKFGHLFMNSVLISSIKVAGGVVINKLFGAQTIKKETVGDKLTETTTPVATLSTDAVNKLTEVFETVIKQYESSKPTIKVNQGEIIKVFVNKDLIFSHNSDNKANIVD